MSKNVFLNKVIATNAVQTNQIDEEHIEAKEYVCANPLAIYGAPPRTTAECLEKFFPGYTSEASMIAMVGKLRPSKKTASGVDGDGNPTGIDTWEEIPEPDGCTLTCAFTETKMCDDISKKIGDTFLGCFYSEPNAPFSCDCPKFGKDFPKLLTAALKNSTFWGTPFESPMARRAFIALLNATKVQVTIDGTFAIRPGYKVNINDIPREYSGNTVGKLHGDWIVLNINHRIFKDRHQETTLTLVRDYTSSNAQNTSTADSNLTPIINIQR
jgi:hypothetical protein